MSGSTAQGAQPVYVAKSTDQGAQPVYGPFVELTAENLADPTQLGSGTRDGTKFLRDDGSWQPATGGVAWGAVTGTLSLQSDLQAVLDGKQAAGTYATGTGTASGTNTGDQTTIAGITGTIAQFNTACTDANFATGGGTATGTNTGDQVLSDATISTTDITTNNATTLKHGFLPKLPGDTATFLRADGAFAAPTATAADPSYSPGSFTVATETQRMAPHRLYMTTTQRITLEGTGRLSCLN